LILPYHHLKKEKEQFQMNVTLSEATYQNIKNDINTLVLSSNEFLNEQQLAERYSISKAPIRSALHRLCMEGIITSHPRKGYLIVTLKEDEFQQVQALRIHNEGYATDLLVNRATREQLDELLRIAQTGRSIKDNMEFHTSLGRFAGNRFLEDIIGKLLSLVTRTYLMHSFHEESSTFAHRHIAIAEAILERNADKARQALAQDIVY
jgi:DNA-binding GntR family transcriptional regulator